MATEIICDVESKSRRGKTATLGLRPGGVLYVASPICANEKLVLTRGQLMTLKEWCEAQLARCSARAYEGEIEGCGGDAVLDRMVP